MRESSPCDALRLTHVQELMPDGLHPSAMGLASIADCLLPLVDKLASGSARSCPAFRARLATAPVSSFQDRQGDEKLTPPLRKGCMQYFFLL